VSGCGRVRERERGEAVSPAPSGILITGQKGVDRLVFLVTNRRNRLSPLPEPGLCGAAASVAAMSDVVMSGPLHPPQLDFTPKGKVSIDGAHTIPVKDLPILAQAAFMILAEYLGRTGQTRLVIEAPLYESDFAVTRNAPDPPAISDARLEVLRRTAYWQAVRHMYEKYHGMDKWFSTRDYRPYHRQKQSTFVAHALKAGIRCNKGNFSRWVRNEEPRQRAPYAAIVHCAMHHKDDKTCACPE